MDVRAENRGRPHQKVRFPAAPVVGRNFLTPEHSGVRVRNVREEIRAKKFMFMLFFLPDLRHMRRRFHNLHEEFSVQSLSLVLSC